MNYVGLSEDGDGEVDRRGAHVVARFKDGAGWKFAIRSDGYILVKTPTLRWWRIYLKCISADAARKFAARERWQEWRGYGSGRSMISSYL